MDYPNFPQIKTKKLINFLLFNRVQLQQKQHHEHPQLLLPHLKIQLLERKNRPLVVLIQQRKRRQPQLFHQQNQLAKIIEPTRLVMAQLKQQQQQQLKMKKN